MPRCTSCGSLISHDDCAFCSRYHEVMMYGITGRALEVKGRQATIDIGAGVHRTVFLGRAHGEYRLVHFEGERYVIPSDPADVPPLESHRSALAAPASATGGGPVE